MTTKNQNIEPKFKKFAYILAWVAFLASVFSAISSGLSDLEPPKKSKYYE